jgi:hypothetical protein
MNPAFRQIGNAVDLIVAREIALEKIAPQLDSWVGPSAYDVTVR